jgi:hypothetical protein
MKVICTVNSWLSLVLEGELLIDKKQKHKRQVLTEEKLEDIGARLERAPRKSLIHLVQDTGVSKSSTKTATQFLKPSSESWCLVCCKCKKDCSTCVIQWNNCKKNLCVERTVFSTPPVIHWQNVHAPCSKQHSACRGTQCHELVKLLKRDPVLRITSPVLVSSLSRNFVALIVTKIWETLLVF